jgi:S-formylglutathione hydrolase FrmB
MARRRLVALALALAPVGARAGEEPTGAGPQLLATERPSARVQVLRLRSPALEGETTVRVLLPEHYDASGATRYPVLYLLHGGAGSSASWLANGDAEAITARYPLLVVMPEGGLFGYYADWWNFGRGGAPRWETHHLSELVPWVDAHFPTVGTRDGRAVAGESMGGLGAIHYAAKRPDLFTAAASFSGAIDTNLFVAPPVVEVSTMAEHAHLPSAVFGPRLTEEVRWRGHNPVDLAENLRGLLLSFDTGSGARGGDLHSGGDPVEWAMHEMGRAMHRTLGGLGIDHRWNDYGAGCHCWYYWQRDLRELLPRLMDRFAHPAPPPSPFSYRSIDATYRAYGWQVALQRPAVEVSRLSDAGPGGFALSGSGAASVTTSRMFEPGQVVRVTTVDAGGTRRVERTADGSGRLAVPVSLGPGNPYQQLSPAGSLWALGQGLPAGAWPSVTAHVTFEPVPARGP